MNLNGLNLKEWNFLRILRLALGVFLLIEATRDHQILLYIMGAFLTSHALLNIGCGAGSACSQGQCDTKAKEESQIKS